MHMADRLAEPNKIRRYCLSKPGARPAAPAFRRIGAKFACSIGSACLLLATPPAAGTPAPQQKPIAIVDFDYLDTSGEVQNQTSKHQALLQAFVGSVRQDLAQSEKYHVVALSCQPGPCSAARSTPAELLGEARRAGATLLLYGGIHKTSTMEQWAKVQVVDVQADKLVFDRLLTFRGDNDKAWQRAEAFLVEELKAHDFSK